ncbi:hypothetical protein PR202_gb15624 [Eleusine coracana subsp. coracana]|uniref:Uncharacterized protein n=1 Tax=Eleusine coracana subsp. coracana TaxID=191504 RepID=A0AAV5EYB2_ELECO|nr:hypothetical protein PR202_gb15624 [Eleusine coracana subsp. coracana]
MPLPFSVVRLFSERGAGIRITKRMSSVTELAGKWKSTLMDGTDLFVEIGMKEEDIATMLFGEKVADLAEDDFDGSKVERQIFEGVFCLTSADGVIGRHQDGVGQTAYAANKTVPRSSAPSCSSSDYKKACCRIVESFTAGNLSSYHVFHPGADYQAHQAMRAPDAGPSEPVLQWTPPPADKVYTRRAVTRRSERARICSALNVESIDTSNYGRQKDGRGSGVLYNHLRMHAHLLMVDAGWRVEGKERVNKSKVDFVYLAPDKLTRLFSLPRAWKCLGQWLHMNSSDSDRMNDCGKEWLSMPDFLSDLKNTLLCIQYEVQQSKQSLSFLQQWQLLDPFMAVVCIDKKVAALKSGNALKAVNSTVILLSRDEYKLLSTRNASSSPTLNHTKTSGQSIRSTAHRIVMDLHDATTLVSSRQTYLNRKKKLPCIKVDQQAEEKSDPLYFPPSYSSASSHLVENIHIKETSYRGYKAAEISDVDNSADIPFDEMLLDENLLFSHEFDEMLLRMSDNVSNEHPDTAVISEPPMTNKEARNGPSAALSVPPEKDGYMRANKGGIDNVHHDDAVNCKLQMRNKDAGDQTSGALSLLMEKSTDLETNKVTLKDPTKTRRLSSEANGNAVVIAEPQVLFVSPQDGTISFVNKGAYNREMWSCLNASHNTMGTNMERGRTQQFMRLA